MVRTQMTKVQIVLLSLTTVIKGSHHESKPNIIVILADDIGVNDVSWNNKNSKYTPNLRRLAKEGIILDNAYTLPVCTPSRAALMTGIYPFKMGLQRGFGKQTPEGIPLNRTILPEYLKEYGYSTHGLGKWHLGFCSDSYTPLKRGFDSFFGQFVGDDDDDDKSGQYIRALQKYIQDSKRKPRSINETSNIVYKYKQLKKSSKMNSNYKFKKECKYESNVYSKKIKDLITSASASDPFFIYLALFTKTYPREVLKDGFKGNLQDAKIRDHFRKMKAMDRSVADIVKALKETGHYENTVIFFMSDNGGREIPGVRRRNNPNYPLRGSKGSMYEGGNKVPGFVHSSLLGKSVGTRFPGLFHMVDIVPTILSLVTGPQGQTHPGLDGLSQWSALLGEAPPPRHTMVYNIDDNMVYNILNGPETEPVFQIAIREDNFKLIWGQPKMLHRSYRKAKAAGDSGPVKQVLELYNLERDPGERHNLASRRPELVIRLRNMALNYYRELVPPRFLGLQTTKHVLDSASAFGGVSGWCRAVVDTRCQPDGASHREALRLAIRDNETVHLYYGTLPDVMDNKLLCVTHLE